MFNSRRPKRVPRDAWKELKSTWELHHFTPGPLNNCKLWKMQRYGVRRGVVILTCKNWLGKTKELIIIVIRSLYRRPDLFNFDDLETSSTRARLEGSFKMAEKYFGVPRYLDSSGEWWDGRKLTEWGKGKMLLISWNWTYCLGKKLEYLSFLLVMRSSSRKYKHWEWTSNQTYILHALLL